MIYSASDSITRLLCKSILHVVHDFDSLGTQHARALLAGDRFASDPDCAPCQSAIIVGLLEIGGERCQQKHYVLNATAKGPLTAASVEALVRNPSRVLPSETAKLVAELVAAAAMFVVARAKLNRQTKRSRVPQFNAFPLAGLSSIVWRSRIQTVPRTHAACGGPQRVPSGNASDGFRGSPCSLSRHTTASATA